MARTFPVTLLLCAAAVLLLSVVSDAAKQQQRQAPLSLPEFVADLLEAESRKVFFSK